MKVIHLDPETVTSQLEDERQEAVDQEFNFFESIDFLSGKSNGKRRQTNDFRNPDLNDFRPGDYDTPEDNSIYGELEELMFYIEQLENNTTEPDFKINPNLKINYRESLTDAQLSAVCQINGSILVIAGAGSGKTRILAYRTAYLIENGIDPKNILLLTFTKKAAREMVGRTEELLKGNFSQKVTGSTFHSFANLVLRKYANLLGMPKNFTILDKQDSEDAIDLLRNEIKFEPEPKAFPKKQRLLEIISTSRNKNLSISQVIEKQYTGLSDFIIEIELLNRGYEKFKELTGVLDFDDLLIHLRDALKNNDRFRSIINSEYQFIMIDEFQDTNQVQAEIADLLAGNKQNLLIVGDDSQCIYGFRGSEFKNILSFPKKYPDCKLVKLEQNHRSTQSLLDFTNQITSNAKIGFHKKLFSNFNIDIKPAVYKFYDQTAEAKFIVDKILDFRDKQIELDRMAVLARSVWLAKEIEFELTRRSIPYILIGGVKFAERRHVKDLLSYLKIIQNPTDAVAWNRVLKLLPGVGSVTAKKILDEILSDNPFVVERFAKQKYFSVLKELLETIKAANHEHLGVLRKIEIVIAYYEPILKLIEEDFEIRELDLEVIANFAAEYENLEDFLSDLAIDPPVNKFSKKPTALTNELEDKKLTISTIHGAKGLEWQIVFVPGLLDGIFPDSRSLSSLEEIEEERRIFYVAASRAEERLYLTMPSAIAQRNAFYSYPSRFLAEIDRRTYDFESMD